MSSNLAPISRPAIAKLLIGAVLMLGILGLFIALAGNASAGGDAKVTVNSTANIDDGDCEGPPNDTSTGNCTFREAINMVNAGDADIINFHPPVFSKEQPGVISLCDDDEGDLPDIERDVVIDSKNSGVILDGGDKDDDCVDPADRGLRATDFDNGFDFKLNGGKNFEIRNIDGSGIEICSCIGEQKSLGTIEITGVIIDNVRFEGILILGTNLESASITNSELSSNEEEGIEIDIKPCADVDLDCKLSDSVIDISGNRINGSVDCDGCAEGVDIEYIGRINSGTKVTVGVTQNEVINGDSMGVEVHFQGCGDGGINVHVDENGEINGQEDDAVRINVFADACVKESEAGAVAGITVPDGDTSDGFDVVVTVNGNGDIENHAEGQEGVQVDIVICCEESDSSVTVEVNDNGRITGEDFGVLLASQVCCGDDNVSDTSVNNNDEITGEDVAGIDILGWAGSSSDASQAGVAGGTGFDADDNVCTITVDGNNEIDGVGWHGTYLLCFAGTFGDEGELELPIVGFSGVPPLSSGDENVATIVVSNNNDIDGDEDGVFALAAAGSTDGEGDDNLATVTVTDNGEITGDDAHGVEAVVLAGSEADEGDDNVTEIIITGNQEIGGNGGDGLNLNSFSGGITAGSEGNSTSVLVDGNGDIEGSGGDESDEGDDGGDGIDVNTIVCCDEANVNTITITNNTGEITGHDGDGIDIGGPDFVFGSEVLFGLCCSVNIITVMDNADNIRGGDDDGLELNICVEHATISDQALPMAFPDEACIAHSVTQLTVLNNSFSDSERDGISICCGGFQLEEFGIKSIISNNVIEGNGDDGIDIESSIGLNIGPGNEIFENGTGAGDNGIEIDWCLGFLTWADGAGSKVPSNSNTITQNAIYDNFGLGIDLVGYDPDEGDSCSVQATVTDQESTVGCVPFPATAINPNDCISFPDLVTQSGDNLIGTACSLCTVEVFWADDDPDNNDGHGEGAEYIISGEADEDGNFSIQLPCDLGSGDLTATATDKLKNTSEFAENLVTLGTSGCATDTPVPTDTPDVTDTPVPPTATPVVKVCGDVNLDGVANSVDASLVLQLKAGLISSLANESNADVNNDGDITSVDAALILQFTAGLIGEDALVCS